MSKTVLALVPHPDDAEFFAGGTLANMINDGARAFIVIATDGRKGSFKHDSETLARLRAQEAHRAAEALGAEPPILLDHPDTEVDRLPTGVLREQFVCLIRQHRPDVLIAQDPFMPLEMHPDHRAVAWAASEAVNCANLPLVHPEHLVEGLEPHFVVEKYFYTTDASSANKIVDISHTLETKLAALAEHESQIAFLVEGVSRQAQAAGLDLKATFGGALDDPLTALTWAVKAQAAQVGELGGVGFGEAFRYARFDPLIEALL